MSLTKTAVNKLLVAERKSMRQKQKNSAFLRKTLNIYNGMVKRAKELGRELPFSVEQLRGWAIEHMTICSYCGEKLTISGFTIDHERPIARGGCFTLLNQQMCCKPCNWQKGKLTGYEFRCLLTDYLPTLPVEAAADVKRRLTIGGKWSFKS